MTTKMRFTLRAIPNIPTNILWFWLVGFVVFEYYQVIAAGKIGGVKTVSSILIFGDSTADPGNNNYIATPFKSNFSPYGRDFVDQKPTGRFTNGRLTNDYIANYVGLKETVPAYLDPTLSVEELLTGVSFASAGSGFDPLTPAISLEHLKEYRAKVEAAVGKEKAAEAISNALFLVSAGTNDFVINYFSLPIRRRNYTVSSYTKFVANEARQYVHKLYDEGARRIGVVGLPPMGCLPVVITLFTDSPILKRDCNTNFSEIARDYNQILQKQLTAMVRDSGARIAYLDAYTPLEEMTLGHKYGFEVVNSGCCGTGVLETSFLCNPNSHVCDDATKYVFWDSIHPTQTSYQLLFQSFRPAIDYLVGN